MRRALRVSLVFAVAATGADARASAPPADPPWVWASATASPTSIEGNALTDRESDLLAHCGVGEAGLRTVAKRLVERKLRDLPYLDLDGLTFAQRVAGEPHVWPRAWIVSGRALDHESTVKKLETWRKSFHDVGERRCGVATGHAADGTEVVAAIALDALGDMAALPVKSHAGTWLSVDAKMIVPASGAHVVVVGPSGEPRTVPTSFDGGRVRARFAPDRPGTFTVQIVAEVGTGPRPVLEAQVFADVEPPTVTPNLSAPGEQAGQGAPDETTALLAMLTALRREENLRPLAHDARLDALALAHASRMKQVHTVGHDVGDGDPAQRLQNAGLIAKESGENVAHAQSVRLAHRALYASPSHRTNLLRQEFDRAGVAVVDDPDGSVWVAEVFAAGL